MKRKTITLLMGALLTVSLFAGCGGKDAGNDRGGGSAAAGNAGSGAEADEKSGEGRAPTVEGKLYTDEYDPEALFRFGMVPAKSDNDMWGYINRDGEWAIEPSFYRTYPFAENGLAFAAVKKRVYGIIDRDGNFVSDIRLTEQYMRTPFAETGVKSVLVQGESEVYPAVLSYKDGELTEIPWDDSVGKLGDFTASGYALVRSSAGSDMGQKFGIVDSDLNYTMAYQERYLAAADIYGPDNHLTVWDTEEGCYCVIDVQGNVLYKLEELRDDPYFADNGLANVDHYGIMDETGKLILSEEVYFTPSKQNAVPDVELSFHYSDWIAFAQGRDYNYKYPTGLIYWNRQGEKMLSCIKGRPMKNGLAAVCIEVRSGSGAGDTISVDENGTAYLTGAEDGKAWVVIDENLKIQYDLTEQEIDELETCYYSDGYAIAMVKDRKADEEYNYIVDATGNRLFERDENLEFPIKSISNGDNQFTGHW